MASYDYNLFFTTVYSSDNGGEFATTTVTELTGTLSEPDADTSFEAGDVIATDTGGSGVAGRTYVGKVTHNGTEFAVFGPTSSLVAGNQYYFVAYEDVPANFTGAGPVIPGASIDTNSFTTCFAAGTLIATPEGETTVETLQIGDLVTCADGRSVPVKWIGRQTLHKLFTPAERFTPVRVGAGALGNGLPHTDLVLTADHALILDGLAINAGALVNDATIHREPVDSLPDRVTYYHVETEAHDVILANGAPAETYVTYVQRRVFDNHAEYLALYGNDRSIPEMSLPRVSSARLLPPGLKARLARPRAA